VSNQSYSIADLARLTGLNVRTIRYYLAQGLLPASGESGPGAHYGAGHLDRLRLTKRLQAQHLPLAEIRSRLGSLADDEIAALIAEADAQADAAPSGRTTSALDYIRGLLAPSKPGLLGGRPRLAGRPAPAGRQSAPVPTPAPVPPPRYAAMGRGSAPPKQGAGVLADEAVDAPADRPALAEAAPAFAPAPQVATPAAQATATATPPAPLAPEQRSQWERLSLGQNIELHVRRPLSRIEQRRVERLITIARQVLNEDQS
jgi:DNA-binding transcriptional MerR regulator